MAVAAELLEKPLAAAIALIVCVAATVNGPEYFVAAVVGVEPSVV